MGLFDFLYQDKDGNLIEYLMSMNNMKINAKDIAIEKAAGMIAKTIAKCELKTYKSKGNNKKSIETIAEDYYTLNIRPNLNESATNFWYRVIMKFLTDPDGAIVIHEGSSLYLADTFTLNDSVNFAKSITNVSVGTLKYDRAFSMNDVLYLRLGDGRIIKHLNSYYKNIGDMLAIAATDYKRKNTRKWNLKIPSILSIQNKETNKAYTSQEFASMISDLLNSDESDVIPFGEGIELNAIGSNDVKTIQDFKDMLTVALNTAAFAYDIPQDLYNGNKTDKSTSVQDFITFALAGPIEIIEDEINAKFYSKESYLKGEKVKIDKSRIKHVDFFDVADAEIKLISAGYSHNALRIAKGLEPIDEPWANEGHINTSNSNEKGGEVK